MAAVINTNPPIFTYGMRDDAGNECLEISALPERTVRLRVRCVGDEESTITTTFDIVSARSLHHMLGEVIAKAERGV